MWHESFASMLTCKTTKWEVIMEWVRKRKQKRIINGMAKSEFDKSQQYDEYISDNFEIFQKHFYRYFMDFTKDKARKDLRVLSADHGQRITKSPKSGGWTLRLKSSIRAAQRTKRTSSWRFRNGGWTKRG